MKERNASTANVASCAYVFNISGLKPAQDPRELIHSGKGGAFDPHGLKWRNKSNSPINLTARSNNFLLREKKLMLNDGWHLRYFFYCRLACFNMPHTVWNPHYKNTQLQVCADNFSSKRSCHWNEQALKHRMEISTDDGCRVLSRTSPSGGWMHYRSDPVLALAPRLHYASVFTAQSCILYKMIMVKESHCLCRPWLTANSLLGSTGPFLTGLE